jgi:hypothetical protein
MEDEDFLNPETGNKESPPAELSTEELFEQLRGKLNNTANAILEKVYSDFSRAQNLTKEEILEAIEETITNKILGKIHATQINNAQRGQIKAKQVNQPKGRTRVMPTPQPGQVAAARQNMNSGDPIVQQTQQQERQVAPGVKHREYNPPQINPTPPPGVNVGPPPEKQ